MEAEEKIKKSGIIKNMIMNDLEKAGLDPEGDKPWWEERGTESTKELIQAMLDGNLIEVTTEAFNLGTDNLISQEKILTIARDALAQKKANTKVKDNPILLKAAAEKINHLILKDEGK